MGALKVSLQPHSQQRRAGLFCQWMLRSPIKAVFSIYSLSVALVSYSQAASFLYINLDLTKVPEMFLSMPNCWQQGLQQLFK